MREYSKTRARRRRGRDARSLLGRHRHRHRAGRGVRARGVLPGHDGPDVSAVLADDRVRRRAVGVQRRDVHAGAVGAAARQRHNPKQGRFFTLGQPRSSTAARTSTCGSSGGLLRWRAGDAAAVRRSASCATWLVYRAVPSSFVPDEDEGYFIAIIQAPSGASLEYTTNIAKQAEQIIMKQPEVLAVFSVGRLQLQRLGAESGPDVRAVASPSRSGGARTSR